MTISTRATIISGSVVNKKKSDKGKEQYGITALITEKSSNGIFNKMQEEIKNLSDFSESEKQELIKSAFGKFKLSNDFPTVDPYKMIVNFYTGYDIATDFSVDSDVDDLCSGDTVIVKFTTKYGKTTIFGKSLSYCKLYPKAVKLEQHGEELIDTFSGMSEGDLV